MTSSQTFCPSQATPSAAWSTPCACVPDSSPQGSEPTRAAPKRVPPPPQAPVMDQPPWGVLRAHAQLVILEQPRGPLPRAVAPKRVARHVARAARSFRRG